MTYARGFFFGQHMKEFFLKERVRVLILILFW